MKLLENIFLTLCSKPLLDNHSVIIFMFLLFVCSDNFVVNSTELVALSHREVPMDEVRLILHACMPKCIICHCMSRAAAHVQVLRRT